MSPDPAGYRLLFDITRDGYRDWGFIGFGLVFILVGVVGIIYRHLLPPIPGQKGRALGAWAVTVCATLWTALCFFLTYREHASLARAVEQGTVRYVEGPVENFTPEPAGGHGHERFDVAGKHFEYSQYVVTPGFNRTVPAGGPIRPGLQVRIGYVGSTIVRLEAR